MELLLGSYIIIEAYLQPWRSGFCNAFDAGMNIALAEMLICGALFLEDTPQKEAVVFLATSVLVGIAAFAAAGVVVAVKRRVYPSPFYDFFVCHHKAHAAAQARYLKQLLQAKASVQVFIDSDDLKQLDTLFDVVKSRVRHLVVYLTSDTLRRPWCAGEVVSAIRAEIRITRLMTQSFVALSEEQLSSPDTYIDSVGCNLSEYNIQEHDVSNAFRAFFRNSSVTQQELSYDVLGTHRFAHAATVLLKQRVHKGPHQPLQRGAAVLVASDGDSDEANASVGILLHGISKDIFQVSEQGVCVMCDCTYDPMIATQIVQEAKAVVVVLSPGCLGKQMVFSAICDIQRMQGFLAAPGPVSVNIPGFCFPNSETIEAACDGNSAGIEPDTAVNLLTAFFKNICISLPTHASQEAIDIQADEVFHRIQPLLVAKPISARSMPVAGRSSTKTENTSGSASSPFRSQGTFSATQAAPATWDSDHALLNGAVCSEPSPGMILESAVEEAGAAAPYAGDGLPNSAACSERSQGPFSARDIPGDYVVLDLDTPGVALLAV